jgi:hypothetical protein
MTEAKWLTRFIFLETIAGVPGMMAGMIRHFHSLRRMKRDNGWIETMLEDAYVSKDLDIPFRHMPGDIGCESINEPC